MINKNILYAILKVSTTNNKDVVLEELLTHVGNNYDYNDEKAGRFCSPFGRERTQNTNDLCRVSKGAGRGFYQDTSWLSCFGKGYPQRKSASHPVKRRFSGIFRTAQRGDNREIPQKAANYR